MKIYHPTLDAQMEVPDSAVQEWVDSGWRKTKPAAVTAPARKASDTTTTPKEG